MVVSSCHHTVSLLLGEWLKLAIWPLRWCHIYVPVVTQRLAQELLHCPAPYFLGIQRSSLRDLQGSVPNDVVVVDVDNNTIHLPPQLELVTPAVSRLTHELSQVLQPHLSSCDRVKQDSGCTQQHLPRELLAPSSPVMLCRKFLSSRLQLLDRGFVLFGDQQQTVFNSNKHQQGGADESMDQNNDEPAANALKGEDANAKEEEEEVLVVFDENMFVQLASKGKAHYETFSRQLVRAQCFSEYLVTVAAAKPIS